ncbi:MAG: response regulator [Gomphosphaeria aponina SAG 52.96 = DSM 107014]|uniref:Response regulator n=1 Tax=Gomphosphaeria aponina SAG 52.96 = DSM 107014 TaxID=1521640 RepID=A0A941GMH3_9CHRO|nr:response regulator [Gomphosphaeria aponina SAG 52.96 = DSM 107014]
MGCETLMVLLIEDDPINVKLIQTLLSPPQPSPLAEGKSFALTCAESVALGIEQLEVATFDVILLDLIRPDSKGLETLVQLKEKVQNVPIVVQTASEDETLVVKAFQMGAQGYLPKKNLDSNLLVYAIRLAIERQQYSAKLEEIEQQQQEQEFQSLELLANSIKTSVTARMFGAEPLRESVPDIFQELLQSYGDLLDLALEERAYKVEHNISEKLRELADKLGFLKAGPRDVVEIHTKVLKEKSQHISLSKAQAYVAEGRLMVLELMGFLTSYYRRYYIGISNINISNKLDG